MKRYYNWYKKKETLWMCSGEGVENRIGHILRGESLLKEVIEDQMIGKRPRRRK